MTDQSRLFEYIARCSDKKELRQMMLNARKRGERSLEDAAFSRLVRLVPEAAPDSLEHDFWAMIQAFELVLSEEKGKTIRLSRTRQKVKRDGIVATLSSWALGKPTDGFRKLQERGMLDLSGEAIIGRHRSHFPEEVLQAAERRLSSLSQESELSALD